MQADGEGFLLTGCHRLSLGQIDTGGWGEGIVGWAADAEEIVSRPCRGASVLHGNLYIPRITGKHDLGQGCGSRCGRRLQEELV